MSKELDQMSNSSTDSPWGEKCVIMTSSQFKVAELAALVFCRVCANTYKSPVTEKRARREHVVVLIKERVVEGKWPWLACDMELPYAVFANILQSHLNCLLCASSHATSPREPRCCYGGWKISNGAHSTVDIVKSMNV
ncbi:serine/threonine-protein kinase ATM-like isoform X1 [Primulina tabacum]|uniref:serine/threonine-protein kinase ATM-like isoform X1 n=1 Tax=Primulina tabacum TaxID=48773 RepID=UPI003F59A0CB